MSRKLLNIRIKCKCFYHHMGMLLFFASTFGFLNAQQKFKQINENEAITIALANHPLLKNQKLKLTIKQKNVHSLPGFGSTDIAFRYGQLYSAETGSYFDIKQYFGSPFRIPLEKQYHQTEIKLVENELKLVEKRIEHEVKQCYNKWIYTHHKFNLLEKQKRWYEDFMRIVNLYYDQGAFDLLQKTKAETEFALQRNRYLQVQDEILLAENELKKHLFIEGDLIPQTEDLVLYEITKDTTPGLYYEMEYLKQEIALTSNTIKLKKAAYYPDISAGYFYQKIGNNLGFHGIQAGISVPLWFFPVRKDINSAQIKKEMAVNSHELREFQSEKEREALIIDMNRYFKQIQYYKEHALHKADLLIHSSQTRFEKEDIDYFEHLDNLSLGMQIQLEYLEIIRKYNEKAIELEYYVK